MKKSILMFLTFTTVVALFACTGDKKNPTEPSKKANIITTVPKSAFIGDTITIVGTNFGDSQGTGFVFFAGTTATDYISWSDNEIEVKVPEGAVSGKLWLEINGEKGNEVDFTLKTIEPKVYEIITIGEQEWMLRNLDVTHYRNGNPIRNAVRNADWIDAGNKHEGAWCYYNNDPANEAIYGKLYNWYAVNDPRGLAPKDYHVADDTEWNVLTTFLSNSSQYWCNNNSNNLAKSIAAKELWSKSGYTCAIGNDLSANNISGFTAFPGGYRYSNGNFANIRNYGYWWSQTEYNEMNAWYRYMFCYNSIISSFNYSKVLGLSVRCIKD